MPELANEETMSPSNNDNNNEQLGSMKRAVETPVDSSDDSPNRLPTADGNAQLAISDTDAANNTRGRHVIEQMLIPADKVGRVVGQQGHMIKSLKQRSGAELQVCQLNTLVTGEPKPLTIGGTQEAVDRAKALVSEILSGSNTSNSQSSGLANDSIRAASSMSGETPSVNTSGGVKRAAETSPENRNDASPKRSPLGIEKAESTIVATAEEDSLTVNFPVELDFARILIGQRGEHILNLQRETQTRIQVNKTPAADLPGQHKCSITGPPGCVVKTQELIQQMIEKHNKERGELVTEQIWIPGTKVGLLIGPKGSMILSLRQQSGADLQVCQNNSCVTGEPKQLTITGGQDAVNRAKALVNEMLSGSNLSASQSSGLANRSIGANASMSGETHRLEVVVPQLSVSKIIGRAGEIVRKIANRTDTKINFQKEANHSDPDRTAIITGKTRDSVEEAARHIYAIVNSEPYPSTPIRNNGQRSYGEEVFFMHVPTTKAGLIIGKQGEIIRGINMETGAYCHEAKLPNQAENERVFRITGTPLQVHHAKHLIYIKVGDLAPDTPLPPLPGQQQPGGYNNQYPYYQGVPQQQSVYPQQWSQMGMQMPNTGISSTCPQMPMMPIQYPQQPVCNQMMCPDQQLPGQTAASPDYSHQWAEYYRQMGMLQQAEAVEQAILSRNM